MNRCNISLILSFFLWLLILQKLSDSAGGKGVGLRTTPSPPSLKSLTLPFYCSPVTVLNKKVRSEVMTLPRALDALQTPVDTRFQWKLWHFAACSLNDILPNIVNR